MHEDGDRTGRADAADPVEVPHESLSRDALYGLAEAFVLREGTDYGERAYSLAQKVDHVLAQLRRGDATIVFEPATGGVDIVLKRELSAAPGRP